MKKSHAPNLNAQNACSWTPMELFIRERPTLWQRHTSRCCELPEQRNFARLDRHLPNCTYLLNAVNTVFGAKIQNKLSKSCLYDNNVKWRTEDLAEVILTQLLGKQIHIVSVLQSRATIPLMNNNAGSSSYILNSWMKLRQKFFVWGTADQSTGFRHFGNSCPFFRKMSFHRKS